MSLYFNVSGKPICGPWLFLQQIAMHPEPFTQDSFLDLHLKITNEMDEHFRLVGGPPLCPIRAGVLSDDVFIANLASTVGAEAAREQLERYQPRAYGYGDFEDGEYRIFVSYNHDALQEDIRMQRPLVAGSSIIHETASAVLGTWLNRMERACNIGSLARYPAIWDALYTLVEGVNCYFSGSPMSPYRLLDIEMRYYLSTKVMTAMKSMGGPHRAEIMDRHFFGALALLKAELAFGFPYILSFLHNPLLEVDETDLNASTLPDKIIMSLQNMYTKASKELGHGTIPVVFEDGEAWMFYGLELGGRSVASLVLSQASQ